MVEGRGFHAAARGPTSSASAAAATSGSASGGRGGDGGPALLSSTTAGAPSTSRRPFSAAPLSAAITAFSGPHITLQTSVLARCGPPSNSTTTRVGVIDHDSSDSPCLSSSLLLSASTYAPLLSDVIAAGKWDAAVRLCRFAGAAPHWAALAHAALAAKPPQLGPLEEAYAGLGAVDKVAYVVKVRAVGSPVLRAAALAQLRGRVDEAEDILLSATPTPLLYCALKLNIKAGRWERALALVTQGGDPRLAALADVCLWYRARHLAALRAASGGGGGGDGGAAAALFVGGEPLAGYTALAAEVGPLDEATVGRKRDEARRVEKGAGPRAGGGAERLHAASRSISSSLPQGAGAAATNHQPDSMDPGLAEIKGMGAWDMAPTQQQRQGQTANSMNSGGQPAALFFHDDAREAEELAL